jgi:nicotinate-nucleotide adenylyltransferase
MSAAPEGGGIGLFGGTFDPVHVGHLRAAEEVAEALGLACVLFVPSAQPPHKQSAGQGPLATAAQRLDWVRAAVAGNPRFGVDAQELEREGPSFTVDTLRVWCKRLFPARPTFVIGQDAFAEIATWRTPEVVLQLADVAVMTRPAAAPGSLERWLPAALAGAFEFASDGRSGRHRESGSRLRMLAITALDVSSSDVRARLRAARSVRYLLPEAIHDAVVRSGVYGPRESSR